MKKQVLKTGFAIVLEKDSEYKCSYFLLGDPKKKPFKANGADLNISAGDIVEYEIYKVAYVHRTNKKGEDVPQWSKPQGPQIKRNITLEEKIENYKKTYKEKLALIQKKQKSEKEI
jgi:hypothetical protein